MVERNIGGCLEKKEDKYRFDFDRQINRVGEKDQIACKDDPLWFCF